MKAAVYLRVSSNEQSTENQLPALQSHAELKGLEIVAYYQEHESAFKSGRQAALQKLIADCREGKLSDVRILLVWSLDRLSRQGISHLLNLIGLFSLYHIKVVSVKEPWLDVDGPMRELLLAVFAFCAEYESRIKAERTRAGLVRARNEGKHLGRPPGRKDSHKRNRRGYLLRYADNDQKKVVEKSKLEKAIAT